MTPEVTFPLYGVLACQVKRGHYIIFIMGIPSFQDKNDHSDDQSNEACEMF